MAVESFWLLRGNTCASFPWELNFAVRMPGFGVFWLTIVTKISGLSGCGRDSIAVSLHSF